MAVRPVLKMGDPRLLRTSLPVDPAEHAALAPLLEDMWDTMRAENGAGLAAPQIGILRRVVIFGYRHNTRYPDAPPVPETVLLNPEITPLSEEREEDWEGCLSVPGLRGVVARYRAIRYRGFGPDGEPIEREAEGFHARVVQHECDHLDGMLYPRRMTDLSRLVFASEMKHLAEED